MNDKTSLLERLNRRETQRLEKLQKAHQAKVDTDAYDENEDYFAEAFKLKYQTVEDCLTQVPTLEKALLPNHFDTIKRDINELQKNVVTSALFLKEFNLKKYLSIVQNLQSKCYELEDTYVPRKKFGFTRKKLPRVGNLKQDSIDDHDSTENNKTNKWNEKLFGFDSKSDEVLNLSSEELYQRDVSLRDLKNCTITLRSVLGTLHMSNLQDCIILCGPVSTSVFVEKCVNCKIVVACQQLRMHTSQHCHVYLHVTSKGIVEDCTDIKTAPYNLIYDDLDKHFNSSSLDRAANNWDRLDDFNWLAPDVPSPNWSVMDPASRIESWGSQWDKLPSN